MNKIEDLRCKQYCPFVTKPGVHPCAWQMALDQERENGSGQGTPEICANTLKDLIAQIAAETGRPTTYIVPFDHVYIEVGEKEDVVIYAGIVDGEVEYYPYASPKATT